jgi:hypothetical protein
VRPESLRRQEKMVSLVLPATRPPFGAFLVWSAVFAGTLVVTGAALFGIRLRPRFGLTEDC